MLRKNNYFQPILNSEGNSKFSHNILYKISSILKPEFEIIRNTDLMTSVTSKKSKPEPIALNNVKETETKLEKETKYKLADLQNLAKNLGIDIKRSDCLRNKKKSDLYQEIKVKLGY